MPADPRRGVVLLEVLVALVLLGAAAASLTALALESGRATERARAADRETRAASAFLDVVALWPREDLERRLGSRHQGAWVLEVQRAGTALYRVTMRDSTGRRELLRTSLYRPDSADVRGADAHP
ncbi:MAG TPA: prepilin-type N-terminal cleavage/methylation domain-containing protein [Gemmatimonadaceae bacterium]|nr:prepilin-type N-terminal cleavage/methylation domain-containing protein [Gemmatimonadaceae bacterium]